MEIESARSHIQFIFLPTILFVSIPVRYFLRKWKRPVAPASINALLAVLTVIIIHTLLASEGHIYVLYIQSIVLVCIYQPTYVQARMLRIDFYTFSKCFHVVLLLSTVGTLIDVLTVAVVVSYLFDVKYSFALLASCVLEPFESRHCISILKELNQVKYLCTFIETHSILTLVVITMIYDICFGCYTGVVVYSYQIITLSIKHLPIGTCIGYIFGKLSTLSLRILYNEPISLIVFSIGLTYFSFTLVEYFFYMSGTGSILVTVICFNLDRHRLSAKVDESVVAFWHTIYYIFEVATMVTTVANITHHMLNLTVHTVVLNTTILYFCLCAIKIASAFVIYPLRKTIPYRIDVKTTLILGWCSSCSGTFSLLILCELIEEEDTHDEITKIIPHLAIVILMGVIINNTLFQLLLYVMKMKRVSKARRINMNICMVCMSESRVVSVAIFKMNRNLANANWDVVRKNLMLRHPYGWEDDDHEEQFSESSKKGVIACKTCGHSIPFLFTEREMDILMSDFRMKILKSRKVSLIRQFQKGVIDRYCLQVLLTIIDSMLETNVKSCQMDIRKYLKTGKFFTFVNKALFIVDNDMFVKPPLSKWKRIFFYIIMHEGYEYAAQVLNAFDFLTCLLYLLGVNDFEDIFIVLVFTLSAMDKIAHLIGYSRQGCISAVRHYFKSVTNVFDFIFFLLEASDFLYICIVKHDVDSKHRSTILQTIRSLRIFRILRLIFIFKKKYKVMVKRMKSGIDANICFGYELSNAVVRSCDEVLEIIDSLIDFLTIRHILRDQLLEERTRLLKIMAVIQRQWPLIAITSKTKQVIRIAIRAMESTLDEMKAAGYLDATEYQVVYSQVFEKQVVLRKMGFVQQNAPKVIFNEISWMENEEEIVEYLYSNTLPCYYDVGDILITKGDYSPGVWIIVSGMIIIHYDPDKRVIVDMETFGALPVIDYASTLKFGGPISEACTSGTSVGELSLLTERPNDATVYAETPTQGYFLGANIMKEAMRMNANPIMGLESRLWKAATINIALALISDSANYTTLTPEQIQLKLTSAFVPKLKCYKMFVVTTLMEDVLLIDGMVANKITGEIFTAPRLLPRNVKKLLLPRSGRLPIDKETSCRLMIIPVAADNQFLIMHAEEDIAEIVSVPSSKCLLHTIQEKQIREMKRKNRAANAASRSRSVQPTKYSFRDENMLLEVYSHLSDSGTDLSKYRVKRSDINLS